MSTWENLKEIPTVTRPTDHKPVSRLYPSLPSTSRLDVCLPPGCAGERLHTKNSDPPLYLPANPQSEEPVSSYERMKAEVSLLKEQNKELFKINEKWAKEYRIMEQFYSEKVQHLNVSQLSCHPNKEKCDKEDKRVVFFQKQEKVKTDKQTREDEVAELRAQNRALTRRGRQQEEEIRRLNQVLKEALPNSQQLEGNSKTPQDLWKHQAEVYKEDFMKEREDREKLMGKYLKLEKRCKKILRELNILESQVTLTPPDHRCSCTNRAKYSNLEDSHLDTDIFSAENSGSQHPSQSGCRHT